MPHAAGTSVAAACGRNPTAAVRAAALLRAHPEQRLRHRRHAAAVRVSAGRLQLLGPHCIALLTENYVCSVLLLNSALFGHDTVHDMQIEPYRVGNGSSVSAKRARVVLLAQGFVNVHDELLYDHARRRLWQCDL